MTQDTFKLEFDYMNTKLHVVIAKFQIKRA